MQNKKRHDQPPTKKQRQSTLHAHAMYRIGGAEFAAVAVMNLPTATARARRAAAECAAQLRRLQELLKDRNYDA